jgi:hypothetical protein
MDAQDFFGIGRKLYHGNGKKRERGMLANISLQVSQKTKASITLQHDEC